jgi:hypothetical protein
MASPTQISPTLKPTAGDATILVVVHETDGFLYLDPKPGDETVKCGCSLYIAAVNRTTVPRTIEVEFAISIDGTGKTKHRITSVAPGAAKVIKFQVDQGLFGQVTAPKAPIDAIVVRYLVRVDNVEVDPDLKIER